MSTSDAIMTYIVFLYSTVVHEAAHAWTAHRLGDSTAYRGGQVSLDPTPHIRREPMGMVVFPILSLFLGYFVGWASAPYDPNWERQYPRRSALMAMAGPASNLLLLLLAAGGIRLGLALGGLRQPVLAQLGWASIALPVTEGGLWAFAATLLSVIFSLNLMLAAFNLLPVPPLDGRAIPLFFLRGRAVGTYLDFIRQPAFGLVGLILSWQLFRSVYPVLRDFAIQCLYPGISYG